MVDKVGNGGIATFKKIEQYLRFEKLKKEKKRAKEEGRVAQAHEGRVAQTQEVDQSTQNEEHFLRLEYFYGLGHRKLMEKHGEKIYNRKHCIYSTYS